MRFDHIEVHVEDIKKYCGFLARIFKGGTTEVLNDEGISMYTSPEGFNIEVKKREAGLRPIVSGFCNPCLRMKEAKSFIQDELRFEIIETRRDLQNNPVYFFKDYEGVMWHIKDIVGE